VRQALIIAGPTCSGKSALALALAERLGGTVINADSMQVYHELRILTARPSPEDEARAPHRLYGVRPAAEPGSVGWWLQAALAAMAAAEVPILCGGTGMYLQALTQGIVDIPDPGPAAREEARALVAQGSAALHARLTEVDPASAAGLRPGDSQRVARAWEVWRGTGQGLASWQARAQTPAPYRFRVIQLDPPRAGLREAVAARFDAMLAAGAVEEVRALLDLRLDPALPAMRAHGVPELGGYLRGELTLEAARERAVLATGQYVKRQATWFRNRRIADPSATHTICARFRELTQFSESERDEILAFVSDRG
jgi:tRNA dimethylallyltransferase